MGQIQRTFSVFDQWPTHILIPGSGEDGYLIDHDPPYLIKTKLGEEGIEWKKEEKPKVYNKETKLILITAYTS